MSTYCYTIIVYVYDYYVYVFDNNKRIKIKYLVFNDIAHAMFFLTLHIIPYNYRIGSIE